MNQEANRSKGGGRRRGGGGRREEGGEKREEGSRRVTNGRGKDKRKYSNFVPKRDLFCDATIHERNWKWHRWVSEKKISLFFFGMQT